MVLEDDIDDSILDDEDERSIKIPINILPRRFVGELVQGRPLCASVLISAVMALLNVWFRFDELVEFNIFTYFNFFVIELAAFLVLKHWEPNAPRMFEIPMGLAGAWITAISLVLIMGTCFVVMIVSDPVYFAIAVGLNTVLVAYYFIGQSYCHRMRQPDEVRLRYLSRTGGVRFGDYNDIEDKEPLL